MTSESTQRVYERISRNFAKLISTISVGSPLILHIYIQITKVF